MTTREYSDSQKILCITDYPGVVQGSLANNVARAANMTAMNLAIQDAFTNGYKLYVPEGRYEIHGGPLIIDASGFKWEGTYESAIVQYDLGEPVMHIGQPLATIGGVIEKIYLDGVYLQYAGTATSGSLGALIISGLWMSHIYNVEIGDVNAPYASRTSVPWSGVYFDPSGNVVPQFSNTFKNWRIKHFSFRGIDMSHDLGVSASTGSTFENIYISCGTSGGYGDLSTGASTDDNCGAFFQMQSQLTLLQFNVEWVATQSAIHLDVCNQVVITAFNFEGVQLKRFYSADIGFIKMAYSMCSILSGSVYDCEVLSGEVSNASVVMLGEEATVSIDNMRVDNNTATANFFLLRNQDGASGNSNIRCALRVLKLNSGHGLDKIDDVVVTGGGPFYTEIGPFSSNTPITLSNASITHYTYNNFGVLRMAPSGGNKTITLSRDLSATDSCRIARGVRRRIHCVFASASSIVVNNYDGATLTTLAGGASGDFVFDGTDWLVT